MLRRKEANVLQAHWKTPRAIVPQRSLSPVAFRILKWIQGHTEKTRHLRLEDKVS